MLKSDKQRKSAESSRSRNNEKDVEILFREAMLNTPGVGAEPAVQQTLVKIKEVLGVSISSFEEEKLFPSLPWDDRPTEVQAGSFENEEGVERGWNSHHNDEEEMVMEEEEEDYLVVQTFEAHSPRLTTAPSLTRMIPELMVTPSEDAGADAEACNRDLHYSRTLSPTSEEGKQADNVDDDLFSNLEDDVAISKRYLSINSAPLYRWSLGMLPAIITVTSPGSSSSGSNSPKLRRQASVEEFDEDEEEREEHELETDPADLLYPGGALDTASTPNIGRDNFPCRLRSPWIAERLKHLAKAFSARGSFAKKAIDDLEDESCSSDGEDETDEETDGARKNLGTDQRGIFAEEWAHPNNELKHSGLRCALSLYRAGQALVSVYEPQSLLNIAWLFVMSLAFAYNIVYIPYRWIFPHELETGTVLFFITDALADLVYLADCFWFKTRLKFIRNGEWIADPRETRRHHFARRRFLVDLLAVAPLDWLVAGYLGSHHHWPVVQRLARLNRLLRIDAFWEFFFRADTVIAYPYALRIGHTLLYKLYIIHAGACVYYQCSWYQGFGATPWTYNNVGQPYLRCFYFAFRTTTSIGGRMPKPSNDFERVYMMAAWLLGVFIFAMVIGQIRDIVATASRHHDYYREVLNKMSDYLRALGVSARLQNRVRFWLSFTWQHQATFCETDILRVLPLKMQADIALSVHHETLERVELFRNIDRSVLRELVLRMRPILYLPGDYICRKGDIGHEMYIVNSGQIHVVGGASGNEILVTLGEGSVFGEIAILGLEGFTRRTADVRAAGYVQLFALAKSDLWETLKNYPEYEAVLKRKVRRILRNKLRTERERKQQTEETQTVVDARRNHLEAVKDIESGITTLASQVHAEPIVGGRPRTPKLFSTVMEMVRPDSKLKNEFVPEITISRMDTLSQRGSFEEMDEDDEEEEDNGNAQV